MVSVQPDVVKLLTGDTVALHATVTGATDTSVTWSISFFDSERGKLLSDGRYIAPDTVVNEVAIVIVRATSNAEPSAWNESVIAIRNRDDTLAADDPVIVFCLDQLNTPFSHIHETFRGNAKNSHTYPGRFYAPMFGAVFGSALCDASSSHRICRELPKTASTGG